MKLSDVYLTLYNVAQGIGWAGVLLGMSMALFHGATPQETFEFGSISAGYLQLAACLEILHAALGFVKSSPVSNFWQWLGRSNALLVFAVKIPELQELWGGYPAMVMLLVWALGETIRYPWYAATLMNDCPAWLTWLRYTAFIPLYPVGVVAEMILLHYGVPYVKERGICSVSLPNTYNFAWDHGLFVQVMWFLYPFIWWQMYSTLLRQRTKKLAGASPAAGAAAAQKED